MFRLTKSTVFYAILSLSIFSFAQIVNAQSIPGINEPITLQTSPEFPTPNSTVTVSAVSYSTDLNRAEFSWYTNNKLVKKGTGVTEISVSVGKTAVSVSVDVKTTDIGTISNSISINPGSVTLLWQSDGYVPPFYKGKALELYGSSFKVTAFPELMNANGKKIDPKNLIYTWQKNGTVDSSQSGYGKDSYNGNQTSYVRGGDDITVEVSSVSKDVSGSGSITISPKTPELLFYENSPLYGIIYEKALENSFNLDQEEISLHVEPFNISIGNPVSGLVSYDWSLNGQNVPDFSGKNEITLRKAGETGGQSTVNLTIQHKNLVLQGGQAGLTIIQ